MLSGSDGSDSDDGIDVMSTQETPKRTGLSNVTFAGVRRESSGEWIKAVISEIMVMLADRKQTGKADQLPEFWRTVLEIRLPECFRDPSQPHYYAAPSAEWWAEEIPTPTMLQSKGAVFTTMTRSASFIKDFSSHDGKSGSVVGELRHPFKRLLSTWTVCKVTAASSAARAAPTEASAPPSAPAVSTAWKQEADSYEGLTIDWELAVRNALFQLAQRFPEFGLEEQRKVNVSLEYPIQRTTVLEYLLQYKKGAKAMESTRIALGMPVSDEVFLNDAIRRIQIAGEKDRGNPAKGLAMLIVRKWQDTPKSDRTWVNLETVVMQLENDYDETVQQSIRHLQLLSVMRSSHGYEEASRITGLSMQAIHEPVKLPAAARKDPNSRCTLHPTLVHSHRNCRALKAAWETPIGRRVLEVASKATKPESYQTEGKRRTSGVGSQKGNMSAVPPPDRIKAPRDKPIRPADAVDCPFCGPDGWRHSNNPDKCWAGSPAPLANGEIPGYVVDSFRKGNGDRARLFRYNEVHRFSQNKPGIKYVDWVAKDKPDGSQTGGAEVNSSVGSNVSLKEVMCETESDNEGFEVDLFGSDEEPESYLSEVHFGCEQAEEVTSYQGNAQLRQEQSHNQPMPLGFRVMEIDEAAAAAELDAAAKIRNPRAGSSELHCIQETAARLAEKLAGLNVSIQDLAASQKAKSDELMEAHFSVEAHQNTGYRATVSAVRLSDRMIRNYGSVTSVKLKKLKSDARARSKKTCVRRVPHAHQLEVAKFLNKEPASGVSLLSESNNLITGDRFICDSASNVNLLGKGMHQLLATPIQNTEMTVSQSLGTVGRCLGTTTVAVVVASNTPYERLEEETFYIVDHDDYDALLGVPFLVRMGMSLSFASYEAKFPTLHVEMPEFAIPIKVERSAAVLGSVKEPASAWSRAAGYIGSAVVPESMYPLHRFSATM